MMGAETSTAAEVGAPSAEVGGDDGTGAAQAAAALVAANATDADSTAADETDVPLHVAERTQAAMLHLEEVLENAAMADGREAREECRRRRCVKREVDELGGQPSPLILHLSPFTLTFAIILTLALALALALALVLIPPSFPPHPGRRVGQHRQGRALPRLDAHPFGAGRVWMLRGCRAATALPARVYRRARPNVLHGHPAALGQLEPQSTALQVPHSHDAGLRRCCRRRQRIVGPSPDLAFLSVAAAAIVLSAQPQPQPPPKP